MSATDDTNGSKGGGDGTAGAGPLAEDDMLALLQQIEQEAQGGATEPQLTVEFGIGDLQDLIADAGATSSDDALTALAPSQMEIERGASATVHGNLGADAPETIAAFGLTSQLAVKVIFGEDESGPSSPL